LKVPDGDITKSAAVTSVIRSYANQIPTLNHLRRVSAVTYRNSPELDARSALDRIGLDVGFEIFSVRNGSGRSDYDGQTG